jgi:multicomponent K+:H+ antiporter subunit F
MTLLSVSLSITFICYGAAMLVALARLLIGPAAQDRINAVDLMSIVGALLIVVVAIAYDSAMPLEAGLVAALFGFVGVSATAKFLLRGEIIE